MCKLSSVQSKVCVDQRCRAKEPHGGVDGPECKLNEASQELIDRHKSRAMLHVAVNAPGRSWITR